MPRIPTPELERLKAEVSVQRLVEASGLALKKSGKDWLTQCPFHEDDTASLVVSPGKNLWHCFGCGIGGGPIDWVIKRQGVSFRHAVELLQAELGASSLAASAAPAAAKERSPVKASSIRTLPAPVTVAQAADDAALLDEAVRYYHQRLLDPTAGEPGRAYLRARGLDPDRVIAAFELGLSDRSLGLRLPLKNRQAGATLREGLQRVGILRESGHEHFNGSVVIPIRNEAGQVVEIYGRKLRDDPRRGMAQHLYLRQPEQGTDRPRTRGVFNLAGVIAAGQQPAGERAVILCEALIDALSFWVHGHTHVTSSFGALGFTDEILAALKANGIERVLIAYDRDAAGDAGADKLAPLLIEAGLEVRRVRFPMDMDANDFARQSEQPRQALAQVLAQAEWVGGVPVDVMQPNAPAPESEPALAQDVSPLPRLAADEPSRQAALPKDLPDLPDTLPEELQLSTGQVRWRVRGWQKNPSAEAMRVNLQARRLPSATEPDQAGAEQDNGLYFVDTLDLYAARGRGAFVRAASLELGLSEDALKRELGAVLLELERLHEAWLSRAKKDKAAPKLPPISAEDHAEALALLKAPDLTRRIVADLHALGVVGEERNLLAAYLAAVSRKLDAPLAILIQSTSAAGKSSLMDAVLQLVPEEERIRYSAMTGQSLFYLGETNLQHKILAIAEEEGVRQAAYALKLLQSDGELTIASTAKDEATGNLSTRQYTVKGPVMLMLTTTAIDVDEELLNRCLVLSVNESREQTAAIHARQRHKQTLEGLLQASRKEAIQALHHNAQRLLSSVKVVNPYASQLTFLADKTRTRRDHMKYLTLIQAIALLHQHQRELKAVKQGQQILHYIEVQPRDIELANEIAHEVLGRTLDELPPQTRNLLTLTRDWVRAEARQQQRLMRDVRFTRRELREALHWGDTQLKVHLARLVELEHLALHRRGLTHAYELLYDAKPDADPQAHLNGLLDVSALQPTVHHYDSERSGSKGLRSGSGRPLVGPRSGGGRGGVDEDLEPMAIEQSLDGALNGHETLISGELDLGAGRTAGPVVPS